LAAAAAPAAKGSDASELVTMHWQELQHLGRKQDTMRRQELQHLGQKQHTMHRQELQHLGRKQHVRAKKFSEYIYFAECFFV
jgi:hypothetical protein